MIITFEYYNKIKEFFDEKSYDVTKVINYESLKYTINNDIYMVVDKDDYIFSTPFKHIYEDKFIIDIKELIRIINIKDILK